MILPYSSSSVIKNKIFKIFLKSFSKLIISFFDKKKYDYFFENSKRGVLTIKNTLVNTYLSFTIDNCIVYSKSTGMLGYKKKQRRIKAAAYKLGKDFSLILKNLISLNKINAFNISLMGYSRYYRAIISNLRKAIKLGVSSKIIDKNTFLLRDKLQLWKLKKRIISSSLKDKLKLPKSFLSYERHLESQLRRNLGLYFFKKKIYDKTSVSHGQMRSMKNYYNNRYW